MSMLSDQSTALLQREAGEPAWSIQRVSLILGKCVEERTTKCRMGIMKIPIAVECFQARPWSAISFVEYA